MAKRRTKEAAAAVEVAYVRCRDCGKHYDEHERDYKGEFFMCRCPHVEGRSVFLNDLRICGDFEKPKNRKI